MFIRGEKPRKQLAKIKHTKFCHMRYCVLKSLRIPLIYLLLKHTDTLRITADYSLSSIIMK